VFSNFPIYVATVAWESLLAEDAPWNNFKLGHYRWMPQIDEDLVTVRNLVLALKK